MNLFSIGYDDDGTVFECRRCVLRCGCLLQALCVTVWLSVAGAVCYGVAVCCRLCVLLCVTVWLSVASAVCYGVLLCGCLLQALCVTVWLFVVGVV